MKLPFKAEPIELLKAKYPVSEDVFRYIESVDENQLSFLLERSCMSVYNLCE